MTTPIPSTDPRPDRSGGWHGAARSVRALSLLQLALVAAVALLILVGSVVTGRDLRDLEAERSRLISAQLAVIDAREDFRPLEEDLLRAAGVGDRPAAASADDTARAERLVAGGVPT